MYKAIVDKKNQLALSFFSWLNRVVLNIHFKKVNYFGLENIPAAGPFLVVANHQSRWDGLLVFGALGRNANYMVSPNELRGFQGAVIKSVGGFPADRRFELMQFIDRQLRKGEGIVIFPEGNVFRDGVVHAFKNGAARVISMCNELGIELPVIPIAIDYDGAIVRVSITNPIQFVTTSASHRDKGALREITDHLQETVTAERDALRKQAAPASLEVQRASSLENTTIQADIA